MLIDGNRFRAALAQTESANNPEAWGDSGLALGRWQMHPAFVWDYGPDEVMVNESWDSVCSRTLDAFMAARGDSTWDPIRLAMEFHLGVHAVEQGRWDADYARRFGEFYYKPTGQGA